MSVHPRSLVCVIGADLDLSTLRGLTSGDIILVEMNGKHPFSTQTCPLVVDYPWTVYSNDTERIVLKHPQARHDLILPYSSVLDTRQEPAVFEIRNKDFGDGPLYVILQFISHKISRKQLDKQFLETINFNDLLGDESVYDKVVNILVERLGKLVHPGWGYNSVLRFALRSNVRARVIEAFRVGDWSIIRKQPKPVIERIARELSWQRDCLKQSDSYDFLTEYRNEASNHTDGINH